MKTSEKCAHCGSFVPLAHKETLSKHKLTMLQTAANHVKATHVNDFALSDLSADSNNYNNFQKLRYHGLVHHVKDNGVVKRGHWLITRRGWQFLRGEIEINKWVKVKQNELVEWSTETIGVKDVYRGAEAIVTTFEYFDDNGNMVGVRPLNVHKNNQLSLGMA